VGVRSWRGVRRVVLANLVTVAFASSTGSGLWPLSFSEHFVCVSCDRTFSKRPWQAPQSSNVFPFPYVISNSAFRAEH
jgi:hypothetical protein